MNRLLHLYESLRRFNNSLNNTLLEKIIGYFRFSYTYFLCLAKIKSFYSKMNTNRYSIHTLVSHLDVPFYIISIFSFLRYIRFNPKIIIYDDGTLTRIDYSILSNVPRIKIITPSLAFQSAIKVFGKKNNLHFHRNNYPFNRKLIDVLLFKRNDEKILLLDSDVLFFHQPILLIKFLTSHSPQTDLLFIKDMQNAYAFPLHEINRFFKINCTEYVNTGVLAFKSNLLKISFVLNFYNNLYKITDKKRIFGPWIEQTGYALFSSGIKSKPLSHEYVIGNDLHSDTICKHYVHDARINYTKDLLRLNLKILGT